MIHLKQYQSAQELEQYLGDPANPELVMSFKRSIELDETEEFPEQASQLLAKWGMSEYYVPVEYEGKLQSYEEFFALIRVLARRDLSIAVSDMHTFLGAIPVWIQGTQQQKEKLANYIHNNGSACLAVSEKAHGSDLLATETQVSKTSNGYFLTGEKWPINKATRTKALTILAKTDENHNSRSLSLFLVYKNELNLTTFSHLPKVKTLGLRASDISGIQFNNSLLSEDALIGSKGSGLEATLQGFFITRTMCAFLSLGAADTALRTTIKLTLSRQLYGKSVWSLAHPQRVLVNAFLDILISDCVAISVTRGLHILTKQFSVLSAIVKSFVPKRIEKVIDDLAVIMGARYYFREEHDYGIFQKVLRDNGIVSVFDGSSIVNLYALILQMRQLAKTRKNTNTQTLQQVQERLKLVFSLDQSLPPVNLQQLELFSRGANDILQRLDLVLQYLYELSENKKVDNQVLQQIITLTHKLIAEVENQEKLLENSPIEPAHEQSFESFERAKNYCALHASASCLLMWLYNRETLGDFFAQGEWLILCLNRLLSPLCSLEEPIPQQYFTHVAENLLKLYQEKRMFSIYPFLLAQ